LRTLLKTHPETWKEGEDLVTVFTENTIDKFYGSVPAYKEIIAVKIEQITGTAKIHVKIGHNPVVLLIVDEILALDKN